MPHLFVNNFSCFLLRCNSGGDKVVHLVEVTTNFIAIALHLCLLKQGCKVLIF